MAPKRSRVTWSRGEKKSLPLYYADHGKPANPNSLRIGSLWRTKVPLYVQPVDEKIFIVVDHYRYLANSWHFWWGNSNGLPIGSIAVYTGQIRMTESNGGQEIRPLRHSFLIGGTVYVTRCIEDFIPVDKTYS